MTYSTKARSLFTPMIASTFFVASVVPTYSAAIAEFSTVSDTNAPAISFDIQPSQTLVEPQIILAFGNSVTNAVVRTLNDSLVECRAAGSEYAASCAAAAYKRAAGAASKPDYSDARRELRKTAKKLDKLVSQNADKKAPKKKGKYGSYKAVKKEAVAKVNKEARKIIQETETKLLRSSGSGTRKVHYQKIAKAVGSTKVIFRS